MNCSAKLLSHGRPWHTPGLRPPSSSVTACDTREWIPCRLACSAAGHGNSNGFENESPAPDSGGHPELPCGCCRIHRPPPAYLLTPLVVLPPTTTHLVTTPMVPICFVDCELAGKAIYSSLPNKSPQLWGRPDTQIANRTACCRADQVLSGFLNVG